jgi:hypothetical protein
MPNMIHMTSATHGDAREYYVVPFVYAYKAASNAADATYFPLELTLAQFVELWWRWKTINLEVTLDHGVGLQTTANVNMIRNAADEIALAEPGASTTDTIGTPSTVAGHFTGSYEDTNWNGSNGMLYITASIRVCHWCLDGAGANQDSEFECTQRLYWQPDDTLRPSIIIDISYDISSPGVEYSARVTNYIPISAPPALSAYGGDATMLGATFPLGVLTGDAYDPNQIAVVFTPASYFTWGGVRDASTGAVTAGRFVRELLG